MGKISDEIFNLYNNRRELFSNKEFMLELLKIDPRYIIYDKTNDKDIYLEFVGRMGEYVTKYGSDPQYNERFVMFLEKISEELNNPKVGDESLYKIPHEFLYEEIRNSVLTGIMDDHIYESSFLSYFELDLKYPKEYGETLEALYRDDSANLYYAGANSHDKIFREGYQINYGGWIERNFWNAHSVSSGFLSILYPGKYGREETIFARIPKGDTMILGSNGEVGKYGTTEGMRYTIRTYLLPKYIIGSAKKEQGVAKFIPNDVPAYEQASYANVGEAVQTTEYYDAVLKEINDKKHAY